MASPRVRAPSVVHATSHVSVKPEDSISQVGGERNERYDEDTRSQVSAMRLRGMPLEEEPVVVQAEPIVATKAPWWVATSTRKHLHPHRQ